MARTGRSASGARATLDVEDRGGAVVLTFGDDRWRLVVETVPVLNPRRLVHLPTGRTFADEDYAYRVDLAPSAGPGFTGGAHSAISATFLEHRLDADGDATTLTLVGRMDFGRTGPTDIEVEHAFTLRAGSERFEERVSLVHRFGRDTHQIDAYRFGFRKALFDRATSEWRDHADDFTLTAIPTRRWRGQFRDHKVDGYAAKDLFPNSWTGETFPKRAAEAWTWSDGDGGFVIAKYCQEHIEFAVVEGESYASPHRATDSRAGHIATVNGGDFCVIWGGAGRMLGAPGLHFSFDRDHDRFDFGVTTIEVVDGDWEGGNRAYAELMRERGHGTPEGFDPPVHWNELYNLSWRGGTNAPLQTLPQLWEEAGIARDMGAEALYFDPGWDVSEGSTIWAEDRLGPIEDFVARLRDEYGLKLSLHCMVHEWQIQDDESIYRRDANGDIVQWGLIYRGGMVCPGSRSWQEQKAARLIALAEGGASFFMIDFTSYAIRSIGRNYYSMDSVRRGPRDDTEAAPESPCWATDHGHSVPMTLEEHAAGIDEVIRRVRAAHPDVVIESHDEITGGAGDYVPLYFQHEEGRSFTERWGFEYMWDCYGDLLAGKALSLYEYNLAYDLPLYLHINLQFDSPNALGFWWYASTCRHLGIGGLTPSDPRWSGHRRAMARYRELKPRFAHGRFVGLAPSAHVHVLDDSRSAVVTLFNLTSHRDSLEFELDPVRLGLLADTELSGDGVVVENGRRMLRVEVDALTPWVGEIGW
jgi:hypothetical protein